MILKNDFYNVVQQEEGNNIIGATIRLNGEHIIFQGHFPGRPVVPGVCMIQIVKEMLESALGKTIQLVQADTIKFLSFIDPGKNSLVQVNVQYSKLEDGKWQVTSALNCGELLCFKLKGIFEAP